MTGHVLITGGLGYLGSILCEHVLAAGWRVTVLDNLSCANDSPSLFHLCANPRFEFVSGDVRDEGAMRTALTRADAIIHLAAIVGAKACDRDPELATSVNVGAVRLLNRLRSPAQLVIFPNTNSGYGTADGTVHCTEESPMRPITLYGRTKVEAEKLLLDSPNVITLRLATVFGMSPRMRLDLLVNHFVWAAHTDRYIVVFEKDFKRNFVHVRDVADCFVHGLTHARSMAGRAFNLGLSSANLSKEGLALAVKVHVPDFYTHFAAVGSDPDKRNYIVSSERLKAAGFEAGRSLDEGIRELLKGYRMMGRARYANAA